MAILFPIVLVVVMLLVVALLLPYGFWGNVINLINVVTAALLATNFWEPLSSFITSKAPGFMFLADIFVIWILFAAFLFGLRTATEFASRVKLRFPPLVERLGNVLFAGWVAWVLVCFLCMTLHMAPLRTSSPPAVSSPKLAHSSASIPTACGWASCSKCRGVRSIEAARTSSTRRANSCSATPNAERSSSAKMA